MFVLARSVKNSTAHWWDLSLGIWCRKGLNCMPVCTFIVMCISPPYPPIAHSVWKKKKKTHWMIMSHTVFHNFTSSTLFLFPPSFSQFAWPLVSLFLSLNAPSIQMRAEGGGCLATSFYKDNSKTLPLFFPFPHISSFHFWVISFSVS